MSKIERIGELPGDLLAAIVLVVATLLFTLLPPLSDTPVRIPLGLLMVLFVPGYTLIAALFPRKGDLDGIERVALSFGLSIAVVPLMGLGLNYTPWGIRLTPVVVSISLFTLCMIGVAYIRRASLPQDIRFSVEFRRGIELAKAELMADEKSRVDKALTVLLILSILLSVTALVYVIVTPKQGEKFTEFYILGPKGKAYDYPTKAIAGNSSTVIVGVVNHEYSIVNYTMNLNFDNSTILKRKMTLEHNQTWEHPVTYVLNHPGDEQKLEFLLYKEDNFTAPYRDLHLWVNVSSGIETVTAAFANAPTTPALNETLKPAAKLNISRAYPPLDDGSSGSGGESYGLVNTGLNKSLKGMKQNITYAKNATIANATNASANAENVSANATNASSKFMPGANISGINSTKALEASNLSHLVNQSMASASQNIPPTSANITTKPAANLSANKSLEGNISMISKAPSAQNASYNAVNKTNAIARTNAASIINVTNKSESQVKKPEVQPSKRNNLTPIQLGSTVPRKTVVLGR